MELIQSIWKLMLPEKTTTTTTEEAVPLDIVLVLDQSGSMANDMGSGSYTLDNKVGYSYNDIKNSSQHYYYLDTDGNYYEVKAASNWWLNNRTYSLYW